ncbi:MAG: hypothetical protein KBG42_10280 [Lachnospiraceae bacterium]|nr:hypothetical protein [Lachnospiraceae bacterium]
MKKNVLITMSLLMVLGIAGCSSNNTAAVVIPEESGIISEELVTDEGDRDPLPAEEDDGSDASGVITDEEALDAVKNFIASSQPDIALMENSDDYTVYFEVESSTGEEIVVLFRSYTASQTRFYIDRQTGDTKVTELVPGIIDEESPTGETFNIKNYMDDEAAAAYSDEYLTDCMWSTASIVTDESGNAAPEWTVVFGDTTIDYGHVEDGEFVADHSDKITLLEQYSEHSFKIQAESATGVKYTYQTSASDETVLEYYETWDESEYPDKYSGSASLCR